MRKLLVILWALFLISGLAIDARALTNTVEQPDLSMRSVTYLGADATGAADSAAVFNNAGTKWPVVLVPSGTYKLGSDVTHGSVWLIFPGVTWTGTGTITSGTRVILQQLVLPANVTIADNAVLCTNASTGVPQACTAAQVEALLAGVYQPISVNRYVVTGSRTQGLVYQNTSAASLWVNVQAGGSAFDLMALEDPTSPPATIVAHNWVPTNTEAFSTTVSFPVPAGYYYMISNSWIPGALQHWTEWGTAAGVLAAGSESTTHGSSYENGAAAAGTIPQTIQLGVSPGVAAGDIIVLGIKWGGTPGDSTVSDGAASVWNYTPAVFNTTDGDYTQFAYCLSSVATGNPTYTITPPGDIAMRVQIMQFRPAAGAITSYDNMTNLIFPAGTTPAFTSAPINTAGVNGIVIGLAVSDNYPLSSPLIGGSAATGYESANSGNWMWYTIYTSAQTGLTASITVETPDDGTIQILALKN